MIIFVVKITLQPLNSNKLSELLFLNFCIYSYLSKIFRFNKLKFYGKIRHILIQFLKGRAADPEERTFRYIRLGRLTISI